MIEPSGFVSRLMTFVLAGCLTALVVLIAALAHMFPLNRTQVFFLTDRPKSERIISIENFNMTAENIEAYKANFIKEYIVARNRIVPSNLTMRQKWRVGDGPVYAYSSIDVYADFKQTDFWYAIMEGKFEPLNFRCDVSFDAISPRKTGGDVERFAVKFRYVCADEFTGHSLSKDFTILLGLQFQTNLKWNERLDNPLGLKVVAYEIESGGGDPLNILQWLKKET
jgi:type IV secretory pathway component VirB8